MLLFLLIFSISFLYSPRLYRPSQLCYLERQRSYHGTSLLHRHGMRGMQQMATTQGSNSLLLQHQHQHHLVEQQPGLLLQQQIQIPRQRASVTRGRNPRAPVTCKASWTVGIRKPSLGAASNWPLETLTWPYCWLFPYLKPRRRPLKCSRHRRRPHQRRPSIHHPPVGLQGKAARGREARLLDSCQRTNQAVVGAATEVRRGQEAEV